MSLYFYDGEKIVNYIAKNVDDIIIGTVLSGMDGQDYIVNHIIVRWTLRCVLVYLNKI
jgi:hypothetical protein